MIVLSHEAPLATIVIPTWNEEILLPRLLRRIADLPFSLEVVIADNSSSDATRQIASNYRCRLVEGGRPAVARNAGAAVATTSVLIFMDADVLPTANAISEALQNVGTYALVYPKLVPLTTDRYIRFCYWVMDHYFRFLDLFGRAQAIGNFLAVTSAVFSSIQFDENVRVGEDADFCGRIAKLHRVKYDHQHSVYVSPRRFYLENRLLFPLKCVFWGVLRVLGLKSSIIPYKWQSYSLWHTAPEDKFPEEMP